MVKRLLMITWLASCHYSAKPTLSKTTSPKGNRVSSNTSKTDASAPVAPTAFTEKATSDLDGDGNLERVFLLPSGTLWIEGQTIGIPLTHGFDDYWGKIVQKKLHIVELDERQKAVLFTQHQEGDVDPDYQYHFYGYHSGTITSLISGDKGYISGPHSEGLTLSEQGVFKITKNWCHKEGAPGEQKTQITSYSWNPSKQIIEKTDDKEIIKQTKCFTAACPYVFVNGTEAGEILRHLSSSDQQGTQWLDLGRQQPGTFAVELRELKHETTYLDTVWLEVDGVNIAPSPCESAWCHHDGIFHVMHHNDTLTITFNIKRAGNVSLIARGYYVPNQNAD